MAVLVVNAGSSSVKAAVIAPDGTARLTLRAEEIGGAARLVAEGTAAPADLPDHASAVSAILARIEAAGIAPGALRAAGHRVVHGGPDLTHTVRVTPEIRDRIAAAAALAPLHNPPALAGIDALTALAPGLPQIAAFDTAFHATIPPVAYRYAIPAMPETEGLRRYGFHGISYAGLAAAMPDLAGRLPERLIALHLGNGASICAIHRGRSVASTMGYSPLEGLTMGTRAGTIDGDAVLALADRVETGRASAILNRDSGLKGLGGASDMRALAADPSPEARFALDHFAYWAVRHAGSMAAAMGGCDAIAFTAGIGENDAAMRARILDGLAWLGATYDPDANRRHGPALHRAGSQVTAWVVPAREEATIARDALTLLEAA